MKKLLLGFLAIFLGISVNAQVWQGRSFKAPSITSVTVTNGSTIPGYYTNLLSTGIVGGTNVYGLWWTNSSGTWVIPTNNTPVSGTGYLMVTNDTTALFVDVPLFADRNGSPFATAYGTNNLLQGLTSQASIMVKFLGASGFTGGTATFVFVGVPDGTNEVTTGLVGSGTPNFTFTITGNGANQNVMYTNVPLYQFAGCKALRLQTLKDNVTAAANNQVTIQEVKLVGFIP